MASNYKIRTVNDTVDIKSTEISAGLHVTHTVPADVTGLAYDASNPFRDRDTSTLADDAAFTVATSHVSVSGGFYKSVRDAVDDGDAGAFAMTSKRAMYVALETPNGDSLADDTNDVLRVGIINGQAGVAANTGTQSANTVRVTMATNDTIVTNSNSITTAVQIMDDWDESDRAKVNLIVGQAGIAAGAGAVGVTTPRVTHASDDPVTTSVQIMDDWDESDRAKVNPIVGQAGVAAGAGAVGVTVQRVTLASDDPAVASLSVIDDWDSTDACKTVGFLINPSSTFTRPADTTAYASGDLVANNTTAGSVTPLSWTAARISTGSFYVRRARMQKSTTSTTNASFRLHLYGASPTCANGDNAAWSTNISTYCGSIDITIDKAFTDGAAGAGVPSNGGEVNVALASGQTLYGLLEARAAYTPGNGENITVLLELHQN